MKKESKLFKKTKPESEPRGLLDLMPERLKNWLIGLTFVAIILFDIYALVFLA